MQKFDFAIVSPSNNQDIIGILSVHALSVKKALKRIKEDEDMAGLRVYPVSKPAVAA